MVRFSFSILMVALAAVVTARHLDQHHFADNALRCIPKIRVKEHHPFMIYSASLDSVLSKPIHNWDLVAGMPQPDWLLDQVMVCAISDRTTGCGWFKRNDACILEDVEYYLRVDSTVQGFLSVTGRGRVRIVDRFEEASRLYFSTTARGIRIHLGGLNGKSRVFSAAYPGRPVELKDAGTLAGDQIFAIIPA